MTTEIPLGRPESHKHCLMCGTSNPLTLGLKFQRDPLGGVSARIFGSSLWQGYKGIIHGGMTASLLDAAMTHALFQRGIEAVTAELKVRYEQPIPWSSELTLRGWVEKSRPPLYHQMRAEIRVGGELMAEAEARFLKPRTPDPAAEPGEVKNA